MKDTNLADMYAYEKHVCAFFYSDDNIVAVSPIVSDMFNYESVARFFSTIGITYTPASKEGDSPPLKDVVDLEFLKLSTRRVRDFPLVDYVGVPKRENVLPSLKWVRKSLPGPVALVTNVNDVLRRCVGWPYGSFMSFRGEITRELVDAGVRLNVYTYEKCKQYWGVEQEAYVDMVCDEFPEEIKYAECFQSDEEFYRLTAPRSMLLVAHMMSGDGDMGSTGDKVQSVVVSADATPTSKPEGGYMVSGMNSVRELCKRWSPLELGWSGGIQKIYTGEFLSGRMISSSEGIRPGHSYWWSRLYSFYNGDVRINVVHGRTVRIMYDNAGLDVEADNAPYLPYEYIHPEGVVGMSNNGYGSGGKLNAFQLPCVTQYRMLCVPRGDASLDRCSAGRVSIDVGDGGGIDNMISIAAGDNMCFMWLREVPTLLVLPTFPLVLDAHMETVVFTEAEGQVVEAGGRPERMSGETDIAERPLSFDDFAKRPQLVFSTEWTTSQAIGTELHVGVVPYSYLGNVNTIGFDQFNYFRGDCEILIKLQSQPFQQGKLMCIFVPCATIAEVDAYISGNRPSQCVGFNVGVFAGGARDVKIRIPFVSPKSNLNIRRDEVDTSAFPAGWGVFKILVFNELRVGIDATQQTANFSVFASFPDPEFSVIRTRGPARRQRVQQEEKFEVVEPVKRGQRRLDAHMGAYASVIATAGNVASSVMDGIDFAKRTQAKFGGKDRDYPNVGTNGPALLEQGGLDMAAIKQVSVCRVLGLTGHDGNDPTGALVESFDAEMSVNHLCGRPVILHSFEFSATDVSGTIKYDEYMTVAPGRLAAAINDTYTPTLLEYTALPFRFWRGDLVLRVEVIGTVFHSGRLAVVTKYGELSSTTSIDEAFSQYAHIIDVASPTNVWDFVLPYKSDREMLRVPHGDDHADLLEYVMGTVVIIVLNPLQYATTVSDSVAVNVYLSGRNMSFKVAGGGVQEVVPLDPYVSFKKARPKRAEKV
jgi:hypothetical protein